MTVATSVAVPLVDRQQRSRGTIEVACLPRAKSDPPPLLDLRQVEPRTTDEPVQLLEATEYRYRISVDDRDPLTVTTDKPDVFDADTAHGREGRLRTGLHTGMLRVNVLADGEEIGTAGFEIRSRKLDYVRHYRWMLNDIAALLAELVMERFAPTAQRFTVDAGREATTLYQRFAFLKSVLESERFDRALGQVLGRPHRVWQERSVVRKASQGLGMRREVAVQLARGQRRIPWNGGALASLPSSVILTRPVETRDTAENRFVKFALVEWRTIASKVGEAMAKADPSSIPVARGVAEATALVERLDLVLANELFREVGDVSFVPFGSQVLQKTDGYRDIFQFYLQAELDAALSWHGADDVYGAGQRNVAALYEFWTFLQIAKLVANSCGGTFDARELLIESKDGLAVSLRRGNTTTVRGRLHRLGRELHLELRFNQSFGSSPAHESWTVELRPDLSLRVALVDQPADPVWLHFDAKYKIEQVAEIFVNDAEDHDVPQQAKLAAKRSDVAKMHAYRDAIRRSAGAYVLYPGTENELRPEYREILPGLGAFSLRPTDTGVADGVTLIASFLDRVLTHLASQFTQHERGRHWRGAVFSATLPHAQVGAALPFLAKPPIDSRVLVHVASGAQLAALRETSRLDITARGAIPTAVLATEYLLLVGPNPDESEVRAIAGNPEVWASAPGNEVRISLVLGPAIAGVTSDVFVRGRDLAQSGRRVVTWQEVAARDGANTGP